MRELLPGGSSPEPPTPPAPPAPSNYDAPGPPANTSTPVAAPEPRDPDAVRTEPVDEQALQADDPQAVEAAVDAAAADALADGITAADDPGQQGAPEPIDEEAEEPAAAAEAAAIGGRVAPTPAPSPTRPISEAERPLAEAGEGEAEGLEQADAELEENPTVGDGIRTPSARSTRPSRPRTTRRSARPPKGPPTPATPRTTATTTSPAATGRRGPEAPSSRSSAGGSALIRAPTETQKTHAGLKQRSRRSDAVVAGPPMWTCSPPPRTRPHQGAPPMSRLFRFLLLLAGAGALVAVVRHISRRDAEPQPFFADTAYRRPPPPWCRSRW